MQPESQYYFQRQLKANRRYTSKSSNAIDDEIKGLLQREAFVFINKVKIIAIASVLEGRFIPAIKQRRTDNEQYKTRFIVQGHKEKYKVPIIRTSRIDHHRNIRTMYSIAAMFHAH